MGYTNEELAKQISELHDDIVDSARTWKNDEENKDILRNKFAALLEVSDALSQQDPVFYDQFEKSFNRGTGLGAGFVKALSILNEDIKELYSEFLENVTENKNQTVERMAQLMKTNEIYASSGSNKVQQTLKQTNTIVEGSMMLDLVKEFLPSVKAEEISDLFALAFSGKLSENYGEISSLPTRDTKVSFVKSLMAKERLYVKVDFDSLTVVDETEKNKTSANGHIFKARGLASQGMIDSAFMNSDKTELVCIVATSNKNTETQKDQLYRIYHTLNAAKQKGDLKIAGADNPEINLVFCNRAFFCTEDKDSAISKVSAGPGGGTKKQEGFHAASNRAEFEKLVSSGENVSKEEMDKLNGLVTLSIIGNGLSYPRFPYSFEVSDLVYANPFTVGADTLWMKNAFDDIKQYTGQEKEQKFFEFLVNYVDETMDVMNKLKSSVEISKEHAQTPLLKQFSSSMSRLISGMSENFSSYNLGKNPISDEMAEKIERITAKIDTFNEKQPNDKINEMIFEMMATNTRMNKKGIKLQEARVVQEELYCQMWNSLPDINPKVKESAPKNIREVMLSYTQDVLSTSQENDSKIKELHTRLDAVTQDMYAKGGSSKTAKVKVSEYFLSAVSSLMCASSKVDQNESYIALQNSKEYKKVQSFSYSSNEKRKNFNKNVEALKDTGSKMADKYEAADEMIRVFMMRNTNSFGALKVIEAGGYTQELENLTLNVEATLKPTKKKKLTK